MSALPIPEWQLQDAKNRFSQVVKAAGEGVPQWVTVHGKRTAVVISADDYVRLKGKSTAQKPLLDDLLRPGLFADDEADALFGRKRAVEPHRKLDL